MVIVLLNTESIQPTSSLVQLSRLHAAIPSLAAFFVWLAVSAVSSPVNAFCRMDCLSSLRAAIFWRKIVSRLQTFSDITSSSATIISCFSLGILGTEKRRSPLRETVFYAVPVAHSSA